MRGKLSHWVTKKVDRVCPGQKWCFQKAILQIKQAFHFDPVIQKILWIRGIGSGGK